MLNFHVPWCPDPVLARGYGGGCPEVQTGWRTGFGGLGMEGNAARYRGHRGNEDGHGAPFDGPVFPNTAAKSAGQIG
ncbi:MAG: hypothetical protein GY835_16445 [bacterium]|nr:hypothetical protein [bacterium]